MPNVPYPYEVNWHVTRNGSLTQICSLSNCSLSPSLTVLTYLHVVFLIRSIISAAYSQSHECHWHLFFWSFLFIYFKCILATSGSIIQSLVVKYISIKFEFWHQMWWYLQWVSAVSKNKTVHLIVKITYVFD